MIQVHDATGAVTLISGARIPRHPLYPAILDLFRRGYDTVQIARVTGASEAHVVKLIADARELERMGL